MFIRTSGSLGPIKSIGDIMKVDNTIKVMKLAKEIADYGEILSGLGRDEELDKVVIKKVIQRVADLHKQIVEIPVEES